MLSKAAMIKIFLFELLLLRQFRKNIILPWLVCIKGSDLGSYPIFCI